VFFSDSGWMRSVPRQRTDSYLVKVGINYRDRRAEPGDVVSDLLPGEVEWMLADGMIEEVSGGTVPER
jgi:hypothetical protein